MTLARLEGARDSGSTTSTSGSRQAGSERRQASDKEEAERQKTTVTQDGSRRYINGNGIPTMFLWGSCNIRTVHGLRQQFDSDIFSPFLKYHYSTVNFFNLRSS
jgi:hypothetical protein